MSEMSFVLARVLFYWLLWLVLIGAFQWVEKKVSGRKYRKPRVW